RRWRRTAPAPGRRRRRPWSARPARRAPPRPCPGVRPPGTGPRRRRGPPAAPRRPSRSGGGPEPAPRRPSCPCLPGRALARAGPGPELCLRLVDQRAVVGFREALLDGLARDERGHLGDVGPHLLHGVVRGDVQLVVQPEAFGLQLGLAAGNFLGGGL